MALFSNVLRLVGCVSRPFAYDSARIASSSPIISLPARTPHRTQLLLHLLTLLPRYGPLLMN
jgi:hypothetical protein